MGAFRTDSVAQTTQSTTVAPYRFDNVAIVAGGFISGIVPHPTAKGLMYLRTDIGGAYRWEDAAQRWVPLTDWVSMADGNLLGIESIAVDPTDAAKLYLAVGTYDKPWAPNGAILRSNNQGRTFQIARVPFKMGGNEDGRFAGERLAVDPNQPTTLYFGSRNDGLWKSTDGAASWSAVAQFPGKSTNRMGINFITFDPGSGHSGAATPVLYAGVSTPGPSLFRSNDAGQTWEPVPGMPTGMLPNHGILDKEGWLYLTYGDEPGPNGMRNGAVWKFNIHTGKWKDITPEVPSVNGAPTFGYGGLAVDAGHPGTLLVATMDHWNRGDEIYRTTTGGAKWTGLEENSVRDASLSPYLINASGNADLGHWIGAMAIDPFDPNHALYGTGATVWATHDLTQKTTHWQVGAAGIEETAVISLISPPKGPNLISGLGDIGCYRNDDFHRSPAGGDLKNPHFSNCESLDFAADDPNLIVRTGHGGGPGHGGISTDNGASWTPFPREPIGAENGGHIAISADGSILLWITGKNILGQSMDHGTHWAATDKAPPKAQVVSDRVHPARFYLYEPGGGKLYVGDGPGVAFSLTSLLLPKDGKIFATPGRPDDLWLSTRSGLWHADAASTVPIAQIGGVDESYALGFGRPLADGYPTLFLSGKVHGKQGIYRSTDTGRTWTQIDDDRHHYGWIGLLAGDPRVFGRVYLGTNGRGIIVGDPATP